MKPKRTKKELAEYNQGKADGMAEEAIGCQEHIKETLKRIKRGIVKLKKAENSQGSYKYDGVYDECLEVIDWEL